MTLFYRMRGFKYELIISKNRASICINNKNKFYELAAWEVSNDLNQIIDQAYAYIRAKEVKERAEKVQKTRSKVQAKKV